MSGRVAADTWTPAQFWIATSGGARGVSGYTLAGIGLHRARTAAAESKAPWLLTHLGSGAIIITLPGTLDTVTPAATAVARCGDWTLFDMPDGWKQTDPDLQRRVAAILTFHGVELKPTPDDQRITPNEARAVIDARGADDAR